MATAEMQLISRIVRTGDMDTVLAWGITTDDFLTAEGAGLFSHIKSYYTAQGTQKAVPGVTVFTHTFPTVPLVDDQGMTTDALCMEVRKSRLTVRSKETATKLVENLDVMDPLLAVGAAQSEINGIMSLGYSKSVDVGFNPTVMDLEAEYDLIKSGVSFSRCPWPWQALEDRTMGIQPDDYVVLYGRPKSMKTWVLCHMISHAYALDKKVVVFTKEMTPKNIFKRILSCIIGLPYDNFRLGKLNMYHEAALRDFTRFIQRGGDEKLHCLSGKDVSGGSDTISWLQAKTDKLKPDLIFIDGLYLMSSETKTRSDHERVMQISRSARAMQINTGIPLICTMQANRKAAQHSEGQLDEIAYSDAIGQDATVAIRVINEKASPTIALVLAGSREFTLHGLRIGGEPSTDFSYKCELTEKDIKKAQEQDVVLDENDGKAKKATVRKPTTSAAEKLAVTSVDSQMRKR